MMKSFGRLLLSGSTAEFARRYVRIALFVIAFVGVAFVASTAPAFATGSGIAAVDSASTSVAKLVQTLAGAAFLVLIALLIWEFIKNRNFLVLGLELAGSIFAGVVAFNAQQFATLVGLSGALVR